MCGIVFKDMGHFLYMETKKDITENLFEQTKDIQEPLGERLSGEPEILHEIQDYVGYGMSREQIQRILEYVPSVFSASWKNPDSLDKLNDKEKEACRDIAKIGPFQIPGPVIERVIEFEVMYRDKYMGNKSNGRRII